jgi:TonB-dependent SusC/RagA subfamily outer membrane receptor
MKKNSFREWYVLLLHLKKLLNIMKFIIILAIASTVSLSAATTYAQGTRLSLQLENATLQDLLKEIGKKTEFSFWFNTDVLNSNARITMAIKDEPVNMILDKALQGKGLTYFIKDKAILIFKTEDLSGSSLFQQSSVTGTVTDATNDEPIIGAVVKIEGETEGTITDLDGKFKLASSKPDAVLVVSFIGYNTERVSINGQTNLTIKLIQDIVKLNELVVVGYGTRLKEELTGSIAKINSDKIENRPVTGTLEAIQGLIPGVTITRQSGEPGNQQYALKIRGASSVNGNVPLVLIDGVQGDLGLINPDDIQDITVLKDAAAAIYGARAADGVLMVTTKRGKKSDKAVVSYSYNLAMKKTGMMKKATSTEHFVKMFNEANRNDGDPQTFSDATLAKIAANDPGVGPGENWSVTSYPMFYQSKDWYGDFFKTSQRQTHNLSISGGEKIQLTCFPWVM